MFLPISISIESPIVIFGYGSVGMRKASLLVDLGFSVIAFDSLEKDDNLSNDNLSLIKTFINSTNFVDFLKRKPPLVIVALGSDDHLSTEIANYCKNHGILVNVVDKPNISSVIFSSILKSGDLCISISTQGTCPFYTKQLSKELDPFVKTKSKWLHVLAKLRKKSKDPKKELNRIYENQDFQLMLKRGNFNDALLLGSEMLISDVK